MRRILDVLNRHSQSISVVMRWAFCYWAMGVATGSGHLWLLAVWVAAATPLLVWWVDKPESDEASERALHRAEILFHVAVCVTGVAFGSEWMATLLGVVLLANWLLANWFVGDITAELPAPPLGGGEALARDVLAELDAGHRTVVVLGGVACGKSTAANIIERDFEERYGSGWRGTFKGGTNASAPLDGTLDGYSFDAVVIDDAEKYSAADIEAIVRRLREPDAVLVVFGRIDLANLETFSRVAAAITGAAWERHPAIQARLKTGGGRYVVRTHVDNPHLDPAYAAALTEALTARTLH